MSKTGNAESMSTWTPVMRWVVDFVTGVTDIVSLGRARYECINTLEIG